MESWKPIETARKDGTQYIVLCRANTLVTTVRWVTGYGRNGREGIWLGGPHDNAAERPTHWLMEMPDVPEGLERYPKEYASHY